MYSTIIRLNKQCKQCKQLDQIGPKRGDAMMPYAVPGPGCTSLFQNPSSNLSGDVGTPTQKTFMMCSCQCVQSS